MGSVDDQISQEELDDMLGVCKNTKERLIIVLAGEAGMRAGEIANMKKTWIKFQEEKIVIPYKEGDWTAKTQNSARTIPYRKLKRILELLPMYFAANNEIGLTRQGVNFIVHRVASRSKKIVHRIYPHSLRSTAAQRFANAGLSEQALCAIMGWGDIRTARNYIKRSGRNVEKELEIAEREGLL